jgi:hypothetical protein
LGGKAERATADSRRPLAWVVATWISAIGGITTLAICGLQWPAGPIVSNERPGIVSEQRTLLDRRIKVMQLFFADRRVAVRRTAQDVWTRITGQSHKD